MKWEYIEIDDLIIRELNELGEIGWEVIKIDRHHGQWWGLAKRPLPLKRHLNKTKPDFYARPSTPWDGKSPFCDVANNRYFFSSEDLYDFISDLPEEEVDSLKLVVAIPQYAPELTEDYFADFMPSEEFRDSDGLPAKLKEAVDAFNATITLAEPLSWIAGKIRIDPWSVIDRSVFRKTRDAKSWRKKCYIASTSPTITDLPGYKVQWEAPKGTVYVLDPYLNIWVSGFDKFQIKSLGSQSEVELALLRAPTPPGWSQV